MTSRRSSRGLAAIALLWSCVSAAHAVDVPTVPINLPNNPADPLTGLGSVSAPYRIGTTEVTNSQYAAFLNAVAASDPNGLYNTNMAVSIGGITRSGSPGSYVYAVATGRENFPVNFVNFWDCARFANWLHNGQPTGPQNNSTTEDGAYTLTPNDIVANSVTRNAGWRWAVASENEWYKAAYYQPAGQGGDSDNYWAYPTASNSIAPTDANYRDSGFGVPRPVKSYSSNFFGTFDMAGNVGEITDTIFTPIPGSSFRLTRGGGYPTSSTELSAGSPPVQLLPTSEGPFFGFRVVQIPSPPSMGLLALAGLLAARRRR
ncbi:MAG: SUMF1/EgtB/PvdO family nonheme iron enzyme [Phycisphaerales bacterium]|nr:SUMF1/EgtB/PvdO family nonheme iron enzyme [Phycisphaerales bacterium]